MTDTTELTELEITRRIAELLGWDAGPLFSPIDNWRHWHEAVDAAGVGCVEHKLNDTLPVRDRCILSDGEMESVITADGKLRAANLALLALLEARVPAA